MKYDEIVLEKIQKLKLNKELLIKNNVPEENIFQLEYFYKKLKDALEESQLLYTNSIKFSKEDYEKEAERLGKEVEYIEGKLQKLWNFEEDENFYTYWNMLPVCECPKLDNEEYYGFKRIINCECPAHGYMCKKEN